MSSRIERQLARDAIVINYVPLAAQIARRFRDRGEPVDDLTQVAAVGLLKAVDGFDGERGVDFVAYAIPTMAGEVKRHFRDKGWMVRVPRRLQERRIEISRATAVLTRSLNRTPSQADLARYLGASEAGALVQDLLGGPDPGLAAVEDRQSLCPLIRALPDRERSIIAMRFYEHMTQSQIAAELGISQMHVSRLLSRTLKELRRALGGGEDTRSGRVPAERCGAGRRIP